MAGFFREHLPYFGGALLLHAAFAGVFGVAMLRLVRDTPPPMLAIDAVIVDASVLRASRGQREQEREAAVRAQLERERKENEARAQREAEHQAEAERQKELEARAQREKEELVERERRAAEEKALLVAAEKERQAEAERKRVADIQRKQKEAEDRRRADAERRAQATRESDLQRALEEEEGRNQAASAGLLNQYIAMIEQRVVRNWTRPMSAKAGLNCQVKVTQAPGGTVLSVTVQTCNGDAAVKQSIEDAVRRSSPLPAPPDPRLFDRTLLLVFKPVDLPPAQ